LTSKAAGVALLARTGEAGAVLESGVALDHRFMGEALRVAEDAAAHGDVPVGAVVVHEGKIVGVGGNRREVDADPTGHAEIVALREACRSVGRWRVDGATLYVTLEPCPMCAGAIVAARVARLVYGADDPKAGAVRSLYRICEDMRLNHRVEVAAGVRADEGGRLLREFFAAARQRARGREHLR
jgi:tRNA(adenine34) deaminase